MKGIRDAAKLTFFLDGEGHINRIYLYQERRKGETKGIICENPRPARNEVSDSYILNANLNRILVNHPKLTCYRRDREYQSSGLPRSNSALEDWLNKEDRAKLIDDIWEKFGSKWLSVSLNFPCQLSVGKVVRKCSFKVDKEHSDCTMVDMKAHNMVVLVMLGKEDDRYVDFFARQTGWRVRSKETDLTFDDLHHFFRSLKEAFDANT